MLRAEPREARMPIVTLAVLGLATLSAMTTQSLVIPLLPRLRTELHTTDAGATWAVTVAVAAGVLATPLLGRIGDLRGRRPVLIAALASCTAGMVLAGTVESFPVLILGRILQGAALPVFPLCLALVREQVPSSRLRGAIGSLSICVSVSAGVALVAAALVASLSSGYRPVLWVAAVPLAVSLLLVVLVVREAPRRRNAPIDGRGAVLLSLWLAAAMVAVAEGNAWGWGSPRTVALLSLTVVAVVAWWRTECAAAEPLVDTRVFLRPPVVAANVVGFLTSFAMLVVWVSLSDFAQTPSRAGYGFSLSTLQTAWIMLPWPVTSAISRPLGPLLLRIVPAMWLLAVGCVISMAGVLFMVVLHSAPWHLFVGCAVTGTGGGLVALLMPVMVVEASPSAQTGVAVGMNQILRLLGQTMGSAAVTALLTVRAVGGFPPESAFVTAFLLAALACAVLVVAVLPWTLVTRSRPASAAAQALSGTRPG
jgi:MFS family permease